MLAKIQKWGNVKFLPVYHQIDIRRDHQRGQRYIHDEVDERIFFGRAQSIDKHADHANERQMHGPLDHCLKDSEESRIK